MTLHEDQNLRTLSQFLSTHRVFSCGLKHEEITAEKVISFDASLERSVIGFERIGLCDTATRKQILGCAHTESNHLLVRLLKACKDAGPEYMEWANHLDRLFTSIYKLDHEKGELEKKLFSASPESRDDLLRQKAEILNQHNTYIMELREIRETITGFLEGSVRF